MTRPAAAFRRKRVPEALTEAWVDLDKPDYQSFWTAYVWRFRHKNPAKQSLRINWRFRLPGPEGAGERFSTDPQFIVLLESFKTVVWGMLTNDDYGRKLSIGTIGSMSGGIREAFRWFVWNGVKDLSQVTASLQQRYLDVLPQLILNKEEVYPGFKAEGYDFGWHSPSVVDSDSDDTEEDVAAQGQLQADEESEDDGVTYAQVANRVGVLYYIHAQRAGLEKRQLKVFHKVPFGGKTFGEVSSSITAHTINRIPALPKAVSVPMLEEVFRWVEEVGPLVADAHRCFQEGRNSPGQELFEAFVQLDAAGFGEGRMVHLPWREREEEPDQGSGQERVKAAKDPVSRSYHRMRLAVLMVRDACVLALQYLAGLRISEVCSPTVAKLKVNGLPSCVYKRQSHDGMMDLYFLKGLLVKGRKDPLPNDWVIGCAPCGSDQVPILVRALDVLHDVFAPFASPDKEMPLFVHFSNPLGMPSAVESLTAADGTDLQRGCRRFIRCFVDLSGLPDYDEAGNSLVRYRESQGQCIRTHQGRKTFAEFCLRTKKSALSHLSLHYGHLTESTTYKGYFQPVQRLADEIEDFELASTVDFFVSRSERRIVFGAMAEVVNRFFEEFKLTSIKDLNALREKVTDIVITHDLRIYFNDNGNCFIRLNPLKSQCHKADGGASWMRNTPNEKTRNVSMCAGCDCLGLDRTHLPFYIKRAETWKAAAEDPRNRVAANTYKQSMKIVRVMRRALGEPVQPG